MTLTLTPTERSALKSAILMASSWMESDDVSDDPELAADYAKTLAALARIEKKLAGE